MEKTIKTILTVTALLTLVIPSIADLNATHLTNPLWPAHARFHFGIQYFATISLNALSLYLLWGRYAERDTRLATVGAALGPLLFWGMFFPSLLLPGTDTWPDGVTPPPGFPAFFRTVHPNLIIALFITVTNGYALWRDGRARNR